MGARQPPCAFRFSPSDLRKGARIGGDPIRETSEYVLMQKTNLSAGEFLLEDVGYSIEEWALIGKITAIAGYIEHSLLETPAYITAGYCGPDYWDYSGKLPGWDGLCDAVKSAARAADIGALCEEFCQAAGNAKAALKQRGKISHAVILSDDTDGQRAVSSRQIHGQVQRIHFEISETQLIEILKNLITAYDWLEGCRDGLSYARGKRGKPPTRSSTRKAAEVLRDRGSVPHSYNPDAKS